MGIIAAAAGILTGVVGFMGKLSEGFSTQTKTLLETYSDRVEKLESRQSLLESKLDEVRAELRATQAHNFSFRRALSAALEWIGDAVEWMNGDRTTKPPSEPDTREWHDLLDSTK